MLLVGRQIVEFFDHRQVAVVATLGATLAGLLSASSAFWWRCRGVRREARHGRGRSRCGFGLAAEDPLFELTDAGLQLSVFACELLFACFRAFEGVAVIAEVAIGVVVGKKARADGTRLRRQGSGGGRGSLQRAWRRLPRRRFIGRRSTNR